MTVEKMLWDVWRNVTSATTGWSLGGGSSKGHLSSSSSNSSKSAQRTRYNRLKSSGGGGGRPTKSISQPANLTGLCSTTIYSSSESLDEISPDIPPSSSSSGLDKIKDPSSASATGPTSLSGIAPKRNGKKHGGPTGGRSVGPMKHSISSFFPFSSCTTSTTTHDKTYQTSSPPEQSSLPMMATTASSSTSVVESSNNGVGFLSNVCNGGASGNGSGSARGNPKNKISLQSSYTTVQMEDDNHKEGDSFWDSRKDKKPGAQNPNQDIICEDDISDLDSDVEHLTCDVCDRAFPTLKQLAAHQRKKRHYGCLQCDSIFPSREVLEYHREQMSHYDYVIDVYEEGEEGDTDFFESEDDEHGIREDEDCDDEERERLL